MCEFLDTFEDYDSTKLCNELQDHQRKNGEFLEDFAVRISHVLFKFDIIDLPSKPNLTILALNPYAPLVQQSQEACPREQFGSQINQRNVLTNHLLKFLTKFDAGAST